MNIIPRLLTLLLLCGGATVTAQRAYRGDLSFHTPDEKRWVDSVFQTMSLDRQLGQLIMLRAHSDRGPDHIAHVKAEIEKYHVGGLCFFQGTPEKQLALTNEYQRLSRLPLMVSMDAEWGLGMRLPDQTISFPKQIALGAIRNNELIYDMGAEIARQMHRMGVNVSFSPVLDVNNNPNNPVINTRSFGEDRYNVTMKGYQYMRGLQENGILASAKHFPGHGDTGVDSHYDLPVINHGRARLDSLELYPFQALIRYGIGSIMAAHLQVPALDPRPNRPTSLSKPVVTDLLRHELGFTGLVFTDGLEMKGVTNHYGNGEVEAEAILADSDILLLPESTPAAIAAIKRYMDEGKISAADIEKKVRRILLSKYRLGLTRAGYPSATNLRGELNSPEAYALKQRLFENAMTLVRDSENLVPVQPRARGKVVTVHVGLNHPTPFSRRIDDYIKSTHLSTSYKGVKYDREKIVKAIGADDKVLVALYSDGSRFLEKVPIGPEVLGLLRAIDAKAELIISVFGNPYSLSALDGFGTVLMAYSRDDVAQDAAAQGIFGANRINGRLPVTASPSAAFNMGLETTPNFRMGYASPEAVGIDGNLLDAKVNKLAREAMTRRATPGLVVLVARNGKIVYEKGFGHHTYRKNRKVHPTDIYDLASLTKVCATTLSIMKLVEDGKLHLDVPISNYLPEMIGTEVEFLTLRPMLAHRAGLRSWIPFYKETLNAGGRPSSQYFRKQRTGDFVVPVTDKMFMHKVYLDSMWHKLYNNELPNEGQYRYSDLGFYIAAKLIDQVSGLTVDEYAARNFYRPMGLETMVYQPLKQGFPRSRIPPTENDDYFRFERVHGTVHDMGAAMLGGVSGHAGLFGSAKDVATIFQMLLQEGTYGGVQYLRPETVRLFAHRYADDTRRGLGFDMKQLNPNRRMNLSPFASERAFGHLGFTGIAAWADPVEDLVFVALANRTFPSMNNNTFGRLDTRLRLHTACYESIMKGKTFERRDGIGFSKVP